MKKLLTKSFLSYSIELIEEEMESIRKLNAFLKAANEESISTQQDVARDRIDRHIVEVVKTSLRFRGRLEEMDRPSEANRRLPGCNEGTAADRIRTFLRNMLCRKLKELMMDFQRARQSIIASFMMKVPSKEVLKKMFSEEMSEEILRTAIYSSGQDRHDAVKYAKNSLLEFYQLFLDAVVLVDSLGEKMNDKEYHGSNAANYNIKGGTKKLNSS
ncbi:syntaxin-123-like [Dendrobium catenatum]|uniref:Syntaxin-123 n=1 Tax=Dendrobium catenatum TaxID=906689 RepID=A0A2I0VYM4_9ASPA|nr:syntaxin-123-like [Dendrobium catenatum]XP_028555191.1 syntaxin-123-like [Dendrobium catenatum]PKU68514.1 Syntaxin-123 [Dendrobium catenatum]